MRWRDTLSLICADAERYEYYIGPETTPLPPFLMRVYLLLTTQGLQASIVFRVAHHLREQAGTSPWSRALVLAGRVSILPVRAICEAVTGIELHPGSAVGPGLYIGHSAGTVVDASVGANCNIGHGATLTREAAGGRTPTLGDRVWVGPGAVVLGNVHIGDDAVIGANAVVTCPVPPRATVVGVPGMVKDLRGSFHLVRYPGCEQDPARLAAMCGTGAPNATPAGLAPGRS